MIISVRKRIFGLTSWQILEMVEIHPMLWLDYLPSPPFILKMVVLCVLCHGETYFLLEGILRKMKSFIIFVSYASLEIHFFSLEIDGLCHSLKPQPLKSSISTIQAKRNCNGRTLELSDWILGINNPHQNTHTLSTSFFFFFLNALNCLIFNFVILTF